MAKGSDHANPSREKKMGNVRERSQVANASRSWSSFGDKNRGEMG